MVGETVIVETKYGPVRGAKKKSFMDDDYYSFLKIPYAQPPIGELRFKDPRPPKPWKLPIDATLQGPSSVHFSIVHNAIEGSEDCLHINIYTKNAFPTKPFPVMVWIHGGAFMRGSSSVEWYGPDYLLQKDIVFVSFNYRLGPLGFLSIDDPTIGVPGNAALKDQSLALRWVRDNINFFGGDPKNITVFGESAGGCSVHYQMVSKMSENLFDRAIVMSGCTLNNWSVIPRYNWAERLAKALGCSEDGDKAAYQFLMTADPAKMAIAQLEILSDEDKKNRILFPFGPTIEPYQSEMCFIDRDPVEMCQTAWSNNIPIMIGGTSEEGLYCYTEAKKDPRILKELGNCEYIVPLEFGLNRESDQCIELGKKIKEFYFGDKEPSEDTIFQYTEIMTDKLFWHGLHRTILSRLQNAKDAATYVYRFNFDSPTFNHFKLLFCGKGIPGVCHADDLSYLFKNQYVNDITINSPEYKTIQRMVSIWTSFATKGDPNTSEIRSKMIWKPVDTSKLGPFKGLNISDEINVIDLPETKRMALWDSLYTATHNAIA